MAYSEAITSPYLESSSPRTPPPRGPRRSSCQKDEKCVDENEVVQGRIFWLPPKDELPEKAVRRAHGKGAVEEGIYNHPVVVVSRPVDEKGIVHFQLITSFQGKKLHEIYGKANEFHASRRSWYLPISPTPDHPDANSKKSKKRFPTLELADGAVLRWDSYVNLRHVYKIEWSYLKSYANPHTPYNLDYRFESESMIRLLSKSKLLTTYETGTQLPEPISHSHGQQETRNPPLPQDGFLGSGQQITHDSSERALHDPPDGSRGERRLGAIRYIFQYLLGWPWAVVKRLWARILTTSVS